MTDVTEKTNEKYRNLDQYIDSLDEKNGALIIVLHYAQQLFGYIPKELQLHIARKLSIPASKVYGVVTFYSFFTMEQKGKHQVNICMGTACFVRGAEDILKEFQKELGIGVAEVSEDRMFSLDCLRCVGACGLAPVVMVGEKVYGRVKVEDVKGIVDDYLGKGGE